MNRKYNAFLSHNSQDKPIVNKIALWLENNAGLSVWLDEWNLIPGDPWQEEIEKALDESQCCVVFLGPNGIGPMQNEEMRTAIEERVSKQTIRVVPVLLPGAVRPRQESKLPRFLRRLTWVVFQNNWNEEDTLHRLICGIKGIPPRRDAKKSKADICPYRGLEVFREQDQNFFFGRESVVQRLKDRLNNNRFLAVLGPSGCGKSSVVQAGLIPHLREQGLVTLFTPREQPLEELAIALRKCYPENKRPPVEQLFDHLKGPAKSLHYIAREALENTDKKNFVLVIDQFEEVFTQTREEEERQRFFDAVLKAVEVVDGPVMVILTIRSDFMGKCAFYHDLNIYMTEHLFQIEPMSHVELRSVIEEPARMVGLIFETGLVNRILNDVDDASKELPLLENALLELYLRRKGTQLTLQAYKEIGGIYGTIMKHSELESKKEDRQKKNGDRLKSNDISEIGDMQEYHLNQILKLLSRWLVEIQVNNATDFFDINRVSEDIARNLLNEIYGYQLVNLNYEKSNYPGIDLGDKHNKIAFQITARTDTKKIKESLEKFIKGPKDIYSNGIRFFILSSNKKPRLNVEKDKRIYPGFDAGKHILTVVDLIREIKSIYEEDREKFNRIKYLLENEFGDMEVEKRKDEKKEEGQASHHQVFISYSSSDILGKKNAGIKSDQHVADMICNALENENIRCWISHRDILPGDDWMDAIIDAVDQAKIIVLVFSDNTEKSKWVKDEILLALEENKTIIPFRIQNVYPKRALKLLKVRFQWIDAYTLPLENHIDRLVMAVRAYLKDYDRYNIEIRKYIEEGRYYQALLIILKAESQNVADNNTRALKEKVIKSLSDDDGQSFKKQTKQGKSINYPESGSTLGRNETIGSSIEIMDKTPIITVYGIPGIGKSVFIHEIRKSKSHNNRLYNRFVVKSGMTVNDLFQKLSLLLGCRDLLNRPEFDLSKQSDFSFLETEAQYRVASLIHLDDAQNLFQENQFRDNAVKEFLLAVTRYYPETRIILECRIVPPDGIFPENIHQSIRLHGIDKGSLILYFKQPFKNNLDFGWELKEDEQELVQRMLCSKGKENIHPLAMVLLANRAYQSNKSPLHIIKDPEAMKELIAESGDLILNDLNQTTMQATCPNMSLNIKMYNEDIPAYLSESLQKCIRELKGDEEIEDFLAAGTVVDEWEDKLRSAVSEKLYGEGWKHLQKIIKLDKERKERLKEEFGYIYDFDKLGIDESQWTQKQGQIEWRRKLWQILSKRNHLILDYVEENIEEPEAVVPDQPQSAETVSPSKPNYNRQGKPPVLIGAELETPALELFEKFLVMCRNDFKIDILKKRKQPSGFQYGYDLEFACQIQGERKLKLRIECKNYADEIKLDDIAGKLATAKLNFSNDPIDHWIVISPNAKIASDLNNCLNSWEEITEYPFKVQVWNQETGVDQLFGLVPEIYDIFYKPTEGHLHPKDWLEEEKREILNFWMKKLEPPLRLPIGWEAYLRQPGILLLEPKESEFEKRYNNDDYVDMNCKAETGAELPQTLEEKIYDWLEEPGSPTIFLLGEFGDGKTFFTYMLTRKLVDKFRESPGNGWLPVRFALKNFSRSYDPDKPKNIQDFLQLRLNELRADIAGWNELRSSGYKILAILDGFDEISKELDPETIQRNIDILINFYENDYFSDMKILITSRKHFFENHKEKEWLIDKLDKPQLLHLAPIDRKITEDYLRKYAAGIGKEDKFNKLKDFHDPIGLASKPLFLDMVQVSLENLPEEDLNEYTLYEIYIMESFKRKENFLHDKRKETPKHKIIENLLKGLELVAQELHRSRKEFVYLSDIKGKKDLKEWLWTLSEPDEKTTVDETGRMAARSLLKRFNVKDQPKGKSWPVDFCHRSMREYFVGRAVCNLLENDMEEAETFLIDCFLTHEILFFAREIMKHRVFDYESRLLDLIRKTRNVEKIDRIKLRYLGGNAVNLLYRYKDKGKLPGNDWKNLVLDGAILPGADLFGKDFSGTSLQFANLDNVNFTHSNFSNCNLTEVRIEETTPVQSIAISPGEKILSLYHDGIIREWSYQRPHGTSSNNLSGNKAEKDMKLMALPGNDLTILHDRYLYFYDRNDLHLDLKAAIEIKPNFRLVKATMDYLLLNEEDGGQNRLLLVDLNKEAIVKTFICAPFTLCDHLDDCALVIFNQDEELQLIDITPGKRTPLVIPTGQKVACISTCKCGQLPGQYLIGLGLYKGAVQIWQIQVNQWKSEKILDQFLHEKGKPVKDISFIDECRIVSGGLDKTIKLLTFNPDGQTVGDPKEFKMTLQCQGMKVDGVIREKIEGKKLKELIDKATK